MYKICRILSKAPEKPRSIVDQWKVSFVLLWRFSITKISYLPNNSFKNQIEKKAEVTTRYSTKINQMAFKVHNLMKFIFKTLLIISTIQMKTTVRYSHSIEKNKKAWQLLKTDTHMKGNLAIFNMSISAFTCWPSNSTTRNLPWRYTQQ